MELIIIIAVIVGLVWWFTSTEKHAEESGQHPLDRVTRKEPDLTTIPDGIGHQSIPVVPVPTPEPADKKPRKPRAKKSAPVN